VNCTSKRFLVRSKLAHSTSSPLQFLSGDYSTTTSHTLNHTQPQTMSHTLCILAFVLSLMVGTFLTTLIYLLVRSKHSTNARPTGSIRPYILGAKNSDTSSDGNGDDDEESGLVQTNSSSPNGEPSPLFIPRAREKGVN
jgi:hypothetical protein